MDTRIIYLRKAKRGTRMNRINTLIRQKIEVQLVICKIMTTPFVGTYKEWICLVFVALDTIPRRKI